MDLFDTIIKKIVKIIKTIKIYNEQVNQFYHK